MQKTILARTGNEAMAEAMKQINPDVCAAYPITPATEIMQIFSSFVSDGLVKKGKVEEIGRAVEGIRKTGLVAGIGAHLLTTVRACAEAQLDPDFYMVTVNRVNYYCSLAAEVGEFMKTIKKPWIGFKVLGAGRETPPDGFRHAFERGADFIAVGMFDWQVRDDAAHVQGMLARGINRDRAWA